MPLFELYRMTKQKLDSATEKNPASSADLSFLPQNDFVELVWENGQILMQGQSTRTRKTSTCNILPSHIPNTIGNPTNTKMGKFGHPISPSAEMGLNQDDDMLPWLNYPLDQHEYSSDFMPELSNDLSPHNNNPSFHNTSSSSSQFNIVSVHHDVSSEHGNVSNISSLGDAHTTTPKSSTSQLCPSSSFPHIRSRVIDNIRNSTHHAVFGDSSPTSASSFPATKTQNQDPRMLSNNSGLMNFSHFSRPAALVKSHLQNIGVNPGSALSRTERRRCNDKGSAASSSNLVESTLINSSSGLIREISNCQPAAVPSKVDVKSSQAMPPQEPRAAESPEAICQEDTFKNDRNPIQMLGESETKGLPDGEKTIEPVVASSSVCSGNSVERASEDPTHNLKRKHRDMEESECPSEDVDEESAGLRKAVPARVGAGSKRSRAAEVHNLSERRRRDRINEKMRALQELIPNCNKVDKASMLDEAIEYLKTLQLQVQIMSMGAGLYMPPMMFPAGTQHMHAAHFSPMGTGIGMGIGFGMGMPDMNGGSSGCPMFQMPQIHGAHYPGQPMSGPTALHGMTGSNFQLFGLPGQGHPISMPHAPLIPLPGGPIMKSVVGSMDNLNSAAGSISKDPMQNINSHVMQNSGANSATKLTSSQCQATNESFAKPGVVLDKCQTSEVTLLGTFSSPNKNDDVANE